MPRRKPSDADAERPTLREGPRTFTLPELAEASGVPAPSIKLYLREGLLPRGDTTRPRRAYYDTRHLRRLAAIRLLRDVAGVGLADMRRSFEAVDQADADAVDVIAPAIDALSRAGGAARGAATPAERARARAEVDALFEERGLRVREEAGSRALIADAMAAARSVGIPTDVAAVAAYLDALRPLADLEVHHAETWRKLTTDKEGALELAVLGTVLAEPILVGLRRALHEHATTALLRDGRREKPAKRRR